MNELVMSASRVLESEEVSPFDIGFGINGLLLSAVATKEDHGYATPKIAFQSLASRENRFEPQMNTNRHEESRSEKLKKVENVAARPHREQSSGIIPRIKL